MHPAEDRGYTLVETLVTLTLLSTLAMLIRVEAADLHKTFAAKVTARGFSDLAQLALRYYEETGKWPSKPAALARRFEEIETLRNRNGEGLPYVFSIPGNSDILQINTNMRNAETARRAADMLDTRLSPRGVLLVMRLAPPGDETIYQAFLRRDGSVAMSGNLNMQGNALINLDALDGSGRSGYYKMSTRDHHDSVLFADTIYVKKLVAYHLNMKDDYFSNDFHLDWPEPLEY